MILRHVLNSSIELDSHGDNHTDSKVGHLLGGTEHCLFFGVVHVQTFLLWVSHQLSSYPITLLSISLLGTIVHTTCYDRTSLYGTTVKISAQDFIVNNNYYAHGNMKLLNILSDVIDVSCPLFSYAQVQLVYIVENNSCAFLMFIFIHNIGAKPNWIACISYIHSYTY